MITAGAILLIIVGLYWIFMSSYSQIFGNFPFRGKTNAKQIALTFDDGPNEPFTTDILDYLDSKNIKATFFQVGNCINKYPEVTLRAYKAGHVIANHSLSHKFTKYFSEPSFTNEISANQAIIKNLIGQTPALFRPPWLFRNPLLLRTVKRLGMTPISGVFGHNLEIFQPSAEKIAKQVVKIAKPGSVIIFHDGYDAKGGNRTETVNSIKIIVEELSTKGYEFVTVDRLYGIKAYQ